MAADRNDDPGVLGNLPRSRPGQRSAKRTSSGDGNRKAATGGKASRPSPKARATAARQRTTRASSSAGTRSRPGDRAGTRPRQPAAAQRSGGDDPITQAVRLAGKVAETGVRTGVGILRRLSGR